MTRTVDQVRDSRDEEPQDSGGGRLGEAPTVPAGPALAADIAFAGLFKAQYPRIQAYLLRRCGDGELSRDLSAEAFRLAWERTLTGLLPDPPWLFVTARNLLANANRAFARAAKARLALAVEQSREPAMAQGQPGEVDSSAFQERVYLALETLPEAQREILIAHYWDALSGAECAALLGCSQAAIWMRLSRARSAFKTVYSQLED
jgi:RNA polymerase sigma-70 factor (ECF subfamily)